MHTQESDTRHDSTQTQQTAVDYDRFPALKPTPDDPVVVFCPHCHGAIDMVQLNCGIFRHGVFDNKQEVQVNPHAPKEECDRLLELGQIQGCGKPFRVVRCVVGNDLDLQHGFTTEVCDYI